MAQEKSYKIDYSDFLDKNQDLFNADNQQDSYKCPVTQDYYIDPVYVDSYPSINEYKTYVQSNVFERGSIEVTQKSQNPLHPAANRGDIKDKKLIVCKTTLQRMENLEKKAIAKAKEIYKQKGKEFLSYEEFLQAFIANDINKLKNSYYFDSYFKKFTQVQEESILKKAIENKNAELISWLLEQNQDIDKKNILKNIVAFCKDIDFAKTYLTQELLNNVEENLIPYYEEAIKYKNMVTFSYLNPLLLTAIKNFKLEIPNRKFLIPFFKKNVLPIPICDNEEKTFILNKLFSSHQYIFNENIKDILTDHRDGPINNTLLHSAIFTGQPLEVIETILEYGIDPYKKNSLNQTALNMLANKNRSDKMTLQIQLQQASQFVKRKKNTDSIIERANQFADFDKPALKVANLFRVHSESIFARHKYISEILFNFFSGPDKRDLTYADCLTHIENEIKKIPPHTPIENYSAFNGLYRHIKNLALAEKYGDKSYLENIHDLNSASNNNQKIFPILERCQQIAEVSQPTLAIKLALHYRNYSNSHFFSNRHHKQLAENIAKALDNSNNSNRTINYKDIIDEQINKHLNNKNTFSSNGTFFKLYKHTKQLIENASENKSQILLNP